ncbi:MAG: hypothetical protein RJA70_674 [Pseudomonadota bacterium]|jgi:cytoskeletal protein CcmA (bactofilin family)
MVVKRSEGSVVGAATEITGNVSGRGALRVDGRINGSLSVDGPVEVTAGSEVRGPLRAESLVLDGVLEGDVDVAGAISVGPRARFQGTLRGARVTIAAGAEVQADLQTDFELKLSI